MRRSFREPPSHPRQSPPGTPRDRATQPWLVVQGHSHPRPELCTSLPSPAEDAPKLHLRIDQDSSPDHRLFPEAALSPSDGGRGWREFEQERTGKPPYSWVLNRRHRSGSLGADGASRNDHLHAAILFPTGGRLVGCNGIRCSHAHRSHRTDWHTLLGQIITDCIRALFRKFLIHTVASGRIRVAVNFQF